MEKFAGFTKITTEFLDGRLEELKLSYEDQDHLQVSVTYEYNNFYSLDYKLQIDLTSRSIDFIAHHASGALDRVELNRDIDFEKAVSKYLFG